MFVIVIIFAAYLDPLNFFQLSKADIQMTAQVKVEESRVFLKVLKEGLLVFRSV